MAEAIGLSGDFAPAFAVLCATVGAADTGASLSLDSGAASFDVGGGDGGGAAPAMEP